MLIHSPILKSLFFTLLYKPRTIQQFRSFTLRVGLGQVLSGDKMHDTGLACGEAQCP